MNDSVTSAIFLVLLSSTTLGSKKKVKTNALFSHSLSVCFSKQKHPIYLNKYQKERKTLRCGSEKFQH